MRRRVSLQPALGLRGGGDGGDGEAGGIPLAARVTESQPTGFVLVALAVFIDVVSVAQKYCSQSLSCSTAT